MKSQKTMTGAELIEAGIHVLQEVVALVTSGVLNDPERAFTRVYLEKQKKFALRIDLIAEDAFEHELHKYKQSKFRQIKVYGEESLNDKKLNLSQEKRQFVLVDAIDGSDLLELGISNWCSAAVFFDPRNKPGARILGSFVALPSGDIYYATCEMDGAFVRRAKNKQHEPVAGAKTTRSVRRASLCFYGQKVENFLSLARHPFCKNLSRLSAKSKKGKKHEIRIFNMAGIPMMLRLIDHRVKEARGIDAVLELKGQKPHDFVPGAYIAHKAGAVIKTATGRPVSWTSMETLLLHPSSRKIKYVITCTEHLSEALFQFLKKKGNVF